MEGESPLVLARRAIERLRRRTLESYLALARDDELELLADRARALADRGPRVLDAIERAEALDLFERGEAGATRAHLARVVSEATLVEARLHIRRAPNARVEVDSRAMNASEALERYLRTAFEPAAKALFDRLAPETAFLARARADANEAARPILSGAKLDEVAIERPAMVDAARAFLDGTAEMAAEARELVAPGADHVLGIARALALGEPRTKMSAVGGELAPLGFDRDLAARVRIEPRASFDFDARPRVLAIDPPHDVRIVAGTIALGPFGELYDAEAVGRALAAALASVALPYALRSPPIGSFGRALGTTIASLACDRAFLRRARDLGSKNAEARARVASAVLLLDTRLHAAAFLARDARDGGEDAAVRLGRAVAARVPKPLAELMVHTPAALGPRVMGRLTGLAMTAALRERYDEDWFRNPRAAEPLRAAAERAGTLAGETFLTELGGSLDAARARIAELFR
jgi:hypothetical protein